MATETWPVVIVGGGPAGLAAAAEVDRAGLRCLLIDDNRRPGGQLLRRPEDRPDRNRWWFDPARTEAARLIGRLSPERVTVIRAGEVIGLYDDRLLLLTDDGGQGRKIKAEAIILATGGRERTMPFPGWTRPGVMTAGGVQVMVKEGGVIPSGSTIIAGSGPLLLAAAVDLAHHGAAPEMVADALPLGRKIPGPGATLALGAKLGQGLGYLARLAASGIKLQFGWRVIAAQGADRLERVTLAPVDRAGRPITGKSRTIEADLLAVSDGLAPNVELAAQAGCRLDYRPQWGGVVVAVDDLLRTDRPGLLAAGEPTGIGGGQKSLIEGRLAGLSAVRLLDPAKANKSRLTKLAAGRRRQFAAAEYLAAQTQAPPQAWAALPDETEICRCEAITVGRVKQALAQGLRSPGALKLALRIGMGRCQGRTCGPMLTDLLAALAPETKFDPAAMLPPRCPVKPVPLSALADLQGTSKLPL